VGENDPLVKEGKPVCAQIKPQPQEPDAVPEVDLTRDAILAAEDRPIRREAVPEWGGYVHLRTMTGAERDQYEIACTQAGRISVRNAIARLLAMTLCDAAGTPLFVLKDIAALNAKSSKALGRIFEIASSMNGLSQRDIETLAGNSAGDQSDNSGSD